MIYILTAVAAIIFALYTTKRDFIKTKPSRTMFGYKLIYTDKKHGKKLDGVAYSKLLRNRRYNIKGKPDYLYKKTFSPQIMPVELKSGKIGGRDLPYTGDLLQLCAYFLIVEEEYGITPKKGLLVYSDYMFKVKNTKKLRRQLLHTVDDMRTMLQTGEQTAEPSYVHCRHCVCKGTVCEYTKDNL